MWITILSVMAIVLAVSVITNKILMLARRRHLRIFRYELRKKKLTMSEAAFLSNFGRPLTDIEKKLVCEVRSIFGRVLSIEPYFIYPHDRAFTLFGSWLTNKDALERIVNEIDADLLITNYRLDLNLAGNFQLLPLTVAEFINSLIAASNIKNTSTSSPKGQTLLGFNILPKDQPILDAALQALANCVQIDKAFLSLNMKSSEFKKVTGKTVKESEFLPELEVILGQRLAGNDSLRGGWLGPDFTSANKCSSAVIFPISGDWAYWLIYNYLRNLKTFTLPSEMPFYHLPNHIYKAGKFAAITVAPDLDSMSLLKNNIPSDF